MNTWKDVAFALAERVRHSDGCPHSVTDLDCPFCADRHAYKVFVAKAGFDPWPHDYSGETIPISEVRAELGDS